MGKEQNTTERLPMGALLALAMTGFICIVTETLPAGLLPQISSGLQVSSALAGQMVTVYALGSLLAAIPLTIATQGWRRRNVLLLTIVGFLLFNSITAWSSQYGVTLIARFLPAHQPGWPGACWQVMRGAWLPRSCRAGPWRWRWWARRLPCHWVCHWAPGWVRW